MLINIKILKQFILIIQLIQYNLYNNKHQIKYVYKYLIRILLCLQNDN